MAPNFFPVLKRSLSLCPKLKKFSLLLRVEVIKCGKNVLGKLNNSRL